jgi:hypothetical protein
LPFRGPLIKLCNVGSIGWLDAWDGELTEARLRRRLRFLVGKYADHAPYWQFVVWGRQLLLMASDVLVRYFYGESAFVQAGLICIELCLCLLLQVRVRPFETAEQNRLEASLLASDALLVAGSIVYFAASKSAQAIMIDACLVLVLIVAPIVFLTRACLLRCRGKARGDGVALARGKPARGEQDEGGGRCNAEAACNDCAGSAAAEHATAACGHGRGVAMMGPLDGPTNPSARGAGSRAQPIGARELPVQVPVAVPLGVRSPRAPQAAARLPDGVAAVAFTPQQGVAYPTGVAAVAFTPQQGVAYPTGTVVQQQSARPLQGPRGGVMYHSRI